MIIGAGISGLASAHFYRKSHPGARILILDNHDDFGGHAKRNEFSINGKTRIGYGGTEAIDTPSSYSRVAKDLLVDIGVDVQKFYAAYHQNLYRSMGLGKGIMFDEQHYGANKLVVGYNKIAWQEFADLSPMNAQAKNDFVRLWTDKRDYFPDLSHHEKLKKLRKMSYQTGKNRALPTM